VATIQHIKTSFSAGELTPSMGGRVDIGKYQIGAELMENMFSEIYGSASNRSGTKFIAETKNNDEAYIKQFKFSSDDIYGLVFTPLTLRFLFNGEFVQFGGGDYEIATPWTDWDTIRQLTFSQSADVMWICSPAQIAVQELKRFTETNWTLTNLVDTPDTDLKPASLAATMDFNGVLGKLEQTYVLGTPYLEVRVKTVSDRPKGVGSLIIGAEVVPYVSWKESAGVYTFTPATTWTPLANHPINDDVTIGRQSRSYVVTGIKDGQESLQSAAATLFTPYDIVESDPVVLTWIAGATAPDSYNIYREEQGEYYWIGTTRALTFSDTGLDWDEGTAPPGDSILPGNKYLRCVAMFQQRLMFANSVDTGELKQNSIWASQTGIFNDFSKSFIAKDTDGFERTLDSGEVNEIRHLIQIGNKLIALTSGGTWSIGSADSVSFNLDTVTASYQGDISGSKYARPLIVQNDVMVVQDKGQVISPLTYNLDQDGYVSNDVSIWSKHLFDGHEIVDWCYQKSPSSIIWMVREDGIMIGLTYLKEQEVWAFHQHNTGKRVDGADTITDKILSVESISNAADNVDDVFMCVEREINSVTKRYVEKMVKRNATNGLGVDTWFVDCGASYAGSPTSTLTGLSHLEGREVVGLGWLNGEKVGTIGGTVTGGSVDISPAVIENAIIGLPVIGILKTMRLSSGDIWNTLQGVTKKIVECTIRCQDTTSFQIAQDEGNFFPAKNITIDTNENGVASKDASETMPGGMTFDGYVFIRNIDPTPISVQCLIMKIDT